MARCFVSITGCAVAASSTILTLAGCVAARDLRPGDRVITRDHGAQTLRDIEFFAAPQGSTAIAIPAGAIGNNTRTIVAPSQRILLRNVQAELYFGESEVLVNAEDLVGFRSIETTEAPSFGFVRLEFDTPEIIYADGFEIESSALTSFEWAGDPLMSRLGLTVSGMPLPPRPVLEAHEAQLLVGSETFQAAA